MGGKPFQHFLCLISLLLCFKACYAKVGCIERERQALLQFQQGVIDDYGILSSWGNGEEKRNCCKWRGVVCSNNTGHVIMLDLPAETDEMGYVQSALRGKLGASLAELKHLQSLNLDFNDFEGSLPTPLGNLSNLQSLNLFWNRFEGIVPIQLGNLSKLKFLDLGHNLDLTCENLDWLSELPLLRKLDLSGVDLSKAIHWPQAINKMPSLIKLLLSDVQLPPIIPTSVSISHINSSSTSLAVLDLSSNGLTSSMYPWLFNFSTSLVYLDLSHNDLNGSIPDSLGNMVFLESLFLRENRKMACENLDWLSGLPFLRKLDLSGVDLSKAIHWPQAISKMPFLKELNLSHTQLPQIIRTSLSISHMNSSSTSLSVLDLSWNGLTSSMYPWLFNFSTSLVYLDLSHNDLNGSIPDALGNMVFLEFLVLTENRKMACENLELFSGLHLLRMLDLSGVDLSKAIHWPQAINKMPSLTILLLSDAQLPPIIQTSLSISHINSSSTSLAVLDLSSNGLTSSMYPWLFNFSTSLVYLDLSRNDLNGSIPNAFGNVTTLAYLDLSSNQHEGDIQKPLRSLRNLRRLYLSRNKLSELVEKDFLACFNNTLKVLDLSYNQLRGTSFPHLQGFSQLRRLDLGFNKLNGTLPESIGQLPQLRVLSIPSNALQGTVSENHLFGLSNLEYLDLSGNSLSFNITLDRIPQFQATVIMLASCKLGPRFPNWLQTQKGLQKVDTSSSGISDVIPNWFWNLSSNFVWLNFSNNDISGTLPNLQATPSGMDMSSNRLVGSIPQSFFNAGWLDLSKNMLSGSISLSNQSRTADFLTHLDLSNNQLSGELPNRWEQWRHLIVLNLANNNFSGKIKNSVGLLYQIQSLHLRNNSLIGALPSSLEKCKDLQLIDFGRNKLSGKIPAWIGSSLINLTVLNLGSNEFNGGIPSNLCQLKRLQMLDLSRNNLSGFIPKCLNNLIALTQKGSSIISYEEGQFNAGWNFTYVDNTWIQWKGKEWEYKNTLGLVRSIDFSSNNLIGEIPVEITDLVKLVALNLSRNNLTGSIPPMIGQLKSLDSLDLSQNQLHGEIPTSLSQIAGLGVLDLSNNILSGKIPTGTQLQTFNDSYEGNPGLCGPPLLKMCREEKKDECGKVSFAGLCDNKDNIQDDASDLLFYGNIVLGFVIGFWGVCGTLLLNPSWRHFYFHYLNKIKDWLLVTTTTNINRLRRNSQS